jgi:hypothetical protein
MPAANGPAAKELEPEPGTAPEPEPGSASEPEPEPTASPEPGTIVAAGSVAVDQALLESRPWARSTIGSLLRAELARAKPRRKVLDLLEDHPFSAGGPHDAAAVLILTSQAVTPLESLVEAIGALVDIEVVRETMTREAKRKGTSRPREVVLEACERALERLMSREEGGSRVH